MTVYFFVILKAEQMTDIWRFNQYSVLTSLYLQVRSAWASIPSLRYKKSTVPYNRYNPWPHNVRYSYWQCVYGVAERLWRRLWQLLGVQYHSVSYALNTLNMLKGGFYGTMRNLWHLIGLRGKAGVINRRSRRGSGLLNKQSGQGLGAKGRVVIANIWVAGRQAVFWRGGTGHL